jgi:hypothetical protein
MPLDNHDDNLDTEALIILFEKTQPARKDVDVPTIIACSNFGTYEHEDGTYSVTTSKWRAIMTFLRNTNLSFRAAALVGSVCILGLLYISLFLSEKIAFAQVKERINAIRTVEYVEASYDGSDRDPNNQVKELTLDWTIDQLKSRLKEADSILAKDIEFELKFLSELQAQKANVLYVRRIRVKGKHLQRTDQLFPMARGHVIRDVASGMTVSFHDDEKRKEVLTKQVTIQQSGVGQEVDIPRIPPTVDFFNQFTSVPKDGVEQLPARTIGGKNVLGLRSSEEHDGMTWTRTYWVEPDSKLPVELWTEVRNGSQLKQHWVMSQFNYDLAMDDELFSTETPTGYTSGEGKIYGIAPK